MRSFGIDTLHMTPVSGFKHKMLKEHASWESILDTDLTPVFVDENADVELSDFSHPENALYVFGKANYAPLSTHGVGHLAVRVDCYQTGMLWPHQALAVVMYNR